MAPPTAARGPAAFSTFGERLRYLRRRQHLTQIDLSIAVGYSTAQISRLEQNHRPPNPSTVQALFVSALGLEHEPDMVERLLELARAARSQCDADAPMPDPGSAVAARLADQQPGPAHDQLNAAGAGQSAQILVTKLFLSRRRADLAPRPRRLARLDTALHVPLTVVSAPAGFGKTTMLADWLAERMKDEGGRMNDADTQSSSLIHHPSNVAWLSLDDGDNDPTTFLRYLIAAAQTIAPTAGSKALTLLQTSQPPGPEALVRVLLNDIAALQQECLLVLNVATAVTIVQGQRRLPACCQPVSSMVQRACCWTAVWMAAYTGALGPHCLPARGAAADQGRGRVRAARPSSRCRL